MNTRMDQKRQPDSNRIAASLKSPSMKAKGAAVVQDVPLGSVTCCRETFTTDNRFDLVEC